MKYKVTYVSKGTVHVTDGVNNYRVEGEGLSNHGKSGADYVLYKDTVQSEFSSNADSKLTAETVDDIVYDIISHFNKNNMRIEIM